MSLSRRMFLGGVAAATAITTSTLSATSAAAQSASQTRIRRDVSHLSVDDKIVTDYAKAVSIMQAGSMPDGTPLPEGLKWENQAQIHQDYCPHGNWFFLPWHRAYVLQFERNIQAILGDDTWALPYWDWTRAPQIPAAFWVEGSSLNYPNRRATPESTISTEFTGRGVINDILIERDYDEFASLPTSRQRNVDSGYGTLEGKPHNHVHGFVGGAMGEL